MNIIIRRDAKMLGLKRYFTGKPCKFGHIAERNTSSGLCGECTRLRHYDYYENNKDRALEYIGERQHKNKDSVNANTRRWRDNNPTEAKAVHRRYYEVNRDRKLASNKYWRSINKPTLQYYNAYRRARILQATPLWANKAAIIEIYTQSVTVTQTTGIPYHVDHIVPLISEVVCGLRWEGNLQIMPATENQSKGNKFSI